MGWTWTATAGLHCCRMLSFNKRKINNLKAFELLNYEYNASYSNEPLLRTCTCTDADTAPAGTHV